MPVEKNSPKSLFMLISSMLVFGTIGIFRRYIPLPSALLAFFRGIIGTLFLLILKRPSGKCVPDKKTLLSLVISGAMIGINWILLFEAYNYTTVSVATLCYYMQPTIVIIMSVFIFGEKMTAKKAICAFVALAGMVLISGVIEGGIPELSDIKGILLGLGAAIAYSTVVIMNKKLSEVEKYFKSIIQLASAAIILLPYIIITGEFAGNAWTIDTVILLLIIGIIHTGISYALYFGSMNGLKTQTVALFSYIDPLTALILSSVILHERLTLLGIIGAALILGSAIACEIKVVKCKA